MMSLQSQSETLYRQFIARSPDGIALFVEEGVCLEANPAFIDMLDYPAEELLQLSLPDLVHSEDISDLLSGLSGGSPNSPATELRLLRKDGSAIRVRARIVRVRGEEESAPPCLVLHVSKLPETGASQAAGADRRKNDEFIAEALRIALIGSWEWDLVRDRVYVTDQLHRIYGIGESDFAKVDRIGELVPDANRESFMNEVEAALREGHLSFEFQLPQPGGGKFLHIRGIVSFSETGEPVKISGTVQDITERKQVELKLQETVERYTSLKKYNHDAVMSLDLEGRIINANAMAEVLTGYKISELAGKSFSMFIDNKMNIKTILSDSLRDMSAEKSINKIIRKDGHTAEVLTTIAPIIINDKNVGCYVIAKDITEQKKLIIAKEAAESTNKAKGEFLAMMSHEIRTPMNGVIGMTDLLLETTTLDQRQREYLDIIRKSGDTLLAIINDILDFSKIDSGKTELVEEIFDVRSCLFEAVDLLSPKAHEKRLDVSFSLSPDIPQTLVGDSKRLKQVLINLIGNAIKYTSSGGVRVAVRKRSHDEGLVELVFMVKDTGIGIPADKVDQLFQPFFQLDNFMTRESEGTGLGLAISKRLVNLMGGEIWVEQTGEPGATFMFTVVMREEEDEEERLLAEMTAADRHYEQRPLRILVAEDNKINQIVLIKMLENQGHAIRIAENGNEVVRKAQEEKFDLIFMDVHMPGINGLEAAVIIRDMLGDRDCPVMIAVTANALKGDREKCLAAGMDDYISKPISTGAVFDMIRKYFGG